MLDSCSEPGQPCRTQPRPCAGPVLCARACHRDVFGCLHNLPMHMHFHLGSGCACTALSVCAPGASSCPDSLPLPLLGPPLLCWGWGEGEFLAGALERRREGGGEEIVDIAEGAA